MLDTGAGVVADPENPSAIADSLRGLFADAEGRSQLSVAARSAARRFCWEKEAPRLLALYESL